MRVDLFAVKLEREPVGTRKSVPVNAPQIIARLIVAVISEFERTARTRAELRTRAPQGALTRHAERIAGAGALTRAQVLLKAVFHNSLPFARQWLKSSPARPPP